MSLETDIISNLRRVREAARTLALCSSEVKNRALARLAGALRESAGAILAANARDLENARAQGVRTAFLERLTLNPARIEALAVSVEQVAALPDPVGEVIAGWRRPNGLEITQVRVPIGVITIVYESRPNVTVEAAVLALKAGNGAVLRGGKESLATNRLLAELTAQALEQAGAPA
ncbi:MAG TPA: gamma-glutamyl-phosphate reductase, partial [Candidatus Binataceae bacterium]|nr:gamma-glutamyl-phosphate reductase [Candidatus Binataceae bacterium]